MQTYQKMKDSGVAWLGDIPASWQMSRGKLIYKSEKVVNKGMVESRRLALTLNGVIERQDGDSIGLNPESLESYQIFNTSDLVFKLIDLENKKTSRVGLVPKNGIMSPAYIRLTPRRRVYAKFYYYFYYSLYLNYVFNNLAGEGVRANLNPTELLNIEVPIVDYQTQVRIADYLDKETALIDNLIAKQRYLLELLEEKRRATIASAITHGINPNVELQNPNNAWISQVPKGWSVRKLKHFTGLITDGTHTTPTYVSEGVPFLSIKDISSGKIDFTNCKYITEQEHRVLAKHTRIEKGDILFTRIGTLGVNVIIDTDQVFDIFVSLGLLKIVPGSINKDYLVYCMSADYYFEYIQHVKAGGDTAAAKFNLGDVANSPIIVPPAKEQNDIVRYLNAELAKLDKLKQKVHSQIDILKERRTCLISSAVTGKVKV